MKNNNVAKMLIAIVLPIILFTVVLKFNTLLAFLILGLGILYIAHSEKAEIFSFFGNYKFARGDENTALSYFEKAYKSKNCSPRAKNAYAYLLIKKDKLESAEKVLDTIINSKYEQGEIVTAKAYKCLILYKKKQISDAVFTLENLHYNFKSSKIYMILGFLYTEFNDYEKSVKFNEEAVEFNNDNVYIMNNLGLAYYKNNEYEKAKEIFEKILSQNVTFADAYYYYGLTLISLNEREKGEENLRKSLSFNITMLSSLNKEEMSLQLKTI